VVVTGVAGAVVLFALAGVASAHVEPDPAFVVKGKTADVEFTVPHGCGSAGTTSVAFEVPSGVKNATITPPAGWTTETVPGQLVVRGPEISWKQEFTLTVGFRAPVRTGKLVWRVVQSCTTGVNRWIEVPVKGTDEPEYPAPVVKVVTKSQARHLARDTSDHSPATHD
jgi:uncharacterized protein YcnI